MVKDMHKIIPHKVLFVVSMLRLVINIGNHTVSSSIAASAISAF